MLQALFDLEATNNELKADLRDLYITAAKEVDAGSRKAIIVHVSSISTVSQKPGRYSCNSKQDQQKAAAEYLGWRWQSGWLCWGLIQVWEGRGEGGVRVL